MSFGFLNHNARWRGPVEVQAALLYEHGSVMTRAEGHWQGRFAVNPDDNEILIVPMNYGYAWLSQDGGTTWSQQGLAGGNSATQPVRCVQYHSEEDTWWSTYQVDGGTSYYRYSEDKGATWSANLTITGTNTYRPRGFFVGADGVLYSGGAGYSTSGNGARVWKLVNPKSYSAAVQRKTGLPDDATHGHGIIDGSHHWMVLGGSKDSITMTPNLAHNSATKNWATGLVPHSDLVAGGAAYVLALVSTVAGVVTLRQFHYASSTTAPPTIAYDFGFSTNDVGLYYGAGKFALLAMSATESDAAYIAFMDDSSAVWTGPHKVRLPVSYSPGIGVASAAQLGYYKDGVWLLNYTTGTYGSNNRGRYVLASLDMSALQT